MVFLKLVRTESQVNHKTQPFWIKVVHLVPNVQTLAGHAVGAIRLAPTTTLQFNKVHKTKYLFLCWVLDGPLLPKIVEFCDLLGTPCAPVSKSFKNTICLGYLHVFCQPIFRKEGWQHQLICKLNSILIRQ